MVRFITFTVLVFLTSVNWSCRKEAEKPKNVKIDLAELTVAQVHQAYRDRMFNSEQLVTAYLERIARRDRAINSLTTVNPDAVRLAKDLDEEFTRTGILRPLHGIPLIVKDNFNTRGLPTTAGSLALKDFVPADDAFMVKKMVEAGAIILAKSNMAEWAFSPMHTESSTAGTTRNPYNLNYVPAGSSGGTAAAIASNFAILGLGSDTGNSIRGPSSHNSLVGFRSTLGLTSRSGIIPLYLRNDVGGPMCRTVEDAVRVLEVIAGFDPKDPLTKYSEGKIPNNYMQFLDKDGLKGARIGVLTELSLDNTDPEITTLFEKAKVDLKRLGAEIIEPVNVPNFDLLRKNQWCDVFRADIEDYLREFVRNDSMKTLEDIIKAGTKSKYAEDSLKYFTNHSGREKNPEITCGDPYTDQLRVAFRKAIEDRMDELRLDALIYPTWNNKPAKIDKFEQEYKGDSNQIVAPHTGQPAFTVPMGFTDGNLPVGIQFLGRMFSEPTLIRFAYSFEQGTRHRVPPKFESGD